MKNKNRTQAPGIITIAILFSLVLYLAGIFSGLYADKVIGEKTRKEIEKFENRTQNYLLNIKKGTGQEMDYLEDYIHILDSNINSLQAQQIFIDTLPPEEKCKFSEISMGYLFEELNRFWAILPFRIEKYEKENELTDEYLALKEKYNKLSLRTWAMAKNRYENCDTNLVHGLYFYSSDCEGCIRQGEQLDDFQLRMIAEGKKVMLFTIDIEAKEPMLDYLKSHHNLTTVPALLINGKTYSDKVFNASELVASIK